MSSALMSVKYTCLCPRQGLTEQLRLLCRVLRSKAGEFLAHGACRGDRHARIQHLSPSARLR